MSADRVTWARETGTGKVPARWGMVLLSVLAFLGAACSDGYPTKDVPAINPSEMTRPELLEKMNALGDQPGLDRRWQYELSQSCRLTITTTSGGIFTSKQSVVVSLASADISMRFDDTDEKFDVQAVQSGASPAIEVSVLEGTGWPAALQMKASLENLRIYCDRQAR
jgi:hypothetical protein